MLDLLDLRAAELRRKTLAELLHVEDVERVEESLRSLKRSGAAQWEVRLNRRAGQAVAVLLSARRTGRGFTILITDLSAVTTTEADRLQLLGMVESAAREWRGTFDAVETPIVILGANQKVTRINRAARMFAGRDYTEIVGHPLSRLGSGEPWKSIGDLAIQVTARRSPAALQVRDAAGRTFDLLAMLFSADEVTDSRVIVVIWDVSALVELQARVEQQRHMARMGALVAGVAHEVRNPLFAISATVDAMEQEAGSGLREYFAVLREEIDRMTRLMQELLVYGRPSTPQFSEVSVAELIQSAVRACTALATKSGVELRANVVQDLRISADSDRLARAIQNVIENAVQHAPARSAVQITAESVARGKAQALRIKVNDRGSGFAPDDLPRLFDPFFSRRRGGTGLGLALVQQIVTEHGGEITAQNGPQGGGEIVILLPLREVR